MLFNYNYSSTGALPLTTSKIFIYQDTKGNITGREISDISETEIYLQGFFHLTESIRAFRKDRVLEYLNHLQEIERKLNYYLSINLPNF